MYYKRCADNVLVFSLALLSIYTSTLLPVVESCWGSSAPNIGAMTPDQKLLNGSQLLIECSLNNNTIEYDDNRYEVNSSMISFKFANQYYNEDRIRTISPTAAQLVVPEATVDDNGMYFCMLNISGLDHHPLVCVSHVIVGYKPQPVVDFKCISLYYRKLHCSWTPPYNPIATTYHLEDSVHNTSPSNYLVRKCGIIGENSCEWTTDTDPPYRNTVLKFHLILTGQNHFGRHSQVFVVDHYSIIKPNIPKNLMTVDVTTNKISLVWKPPEYIEYDEELLEAIVYEVQYHWRVPNTSNQNQNSRPVIIDGIHNTSIVLTDLIPYMSYNISIRCKTIQSKSSEYWSDFKSITVLTKPDVPYLAPELIRESFQTDKNMEGMRSITLFWKEIPIEYRNGKDFHYSIEYKEQMYRKQRASNLLDKGFNDMIISHNTSYTLTHMKSNVAYTFKITGVNAQGVSRNSSTITVNRNDIIAHKPLNIDVYSFGGGRYEVQWTEPRNNTMSGSVVNYTVFWCRTLRPRPFPCDGAIDWVHTNNKSIALELPDIRSNYQFAVSANTLTTTSGMSWAECIVPIDGRLDKLSEVHLKGLNSTSIAVSWKLGCPAQKRVVEGYKINYCKLEILDICTQSGSRHITVNNSVESYTLSGLLPFTKYKITVVSFSDSGPSDESDPKFETTEHDSPEDAPSSLEVANITSDSLSLSWRPPKLPNGKIFSYEIKCNHNVYKEDKVSHICNADGCSKTINGLKSFWIYDIQVRACNNDALCSPYTPSKAIKTSAWIPQQMDPPRSEVFNTTSVRISWSAPVLANGPIDYYNLELIRTDNSTALRVRSGMANGPIDYYNLELIRTDNSTALYNISGKQRDYYLSLDCGSGRDESVEYRQQYSVRIRAVNVVHNDTELVGVYSETANLNACLFNDRNIVTIIGLVAGGTFGLMLLVMVLVVLVRWMKRHIRSINSLNIELPKGLEVPQLVTDQSDRDNRDGGFSPFARNDSIPNMVVPNNDGDDDDSFKNRHGSGLSHTSNSSTEGLIYRNTPNKGNDNFLRMASHDSGQHESVSSHMSGGEAHMSSDSGVEIDAQLLSIDIEAQHINRISPKPPLPILDEISSRNSDSSGSKDSGLDINAGLVRKQRKRKPKNMKTNSKISSIIMPTRTEVQNPLYDIQNPMGHAVCIYSLLANSEPSLCEPALREDDNILSDLTKFTKPEMAKSLTNIIQSCGPSDPKVNCIICETNNTSNRTSSPNCPYYKYGIKRQNHIPNNYVTNFTPEKGNKMDAKPTNGYITIDSIMDSRQTLPPKPLKKRLEHDWSQNSYDAEVSSTSSNGDNDHTDVSNPTNFTHNCVNFTDCQKIQNTDNTTDTQTNAICINNSSIYPLRTSSQEVDDECETHLSDSEEWTALSGAKQSPTNESNVFVRDRNQTDM
ncbi:unnamed protein product [Oppiella nova]|uniref:Cytokine receptor n=1 Tax=Oppiella nova TaxID=334625 RepID=A0A7R9LU82_9ACAR|nr:unnamed protein product [Oppiella nova]CAG2167021.1 unnamed protein product [Oppiella nova]